MWQWEAPELRWTGFFLALWILQDFVISACIFLDTLPGWSHNPAAGEPRAGVPDVVRSDGGVDTICRWIAIYPTTHHHRHRRPQLGLRSERCHTMIS
ncbi:uncharacterized protein LAJ45_08265 [Morchella importuna]|uniref:uncharacterized protein n=1 Tax=Morchella importuna TaxID=1174673 RepID=UPI001E8DBFCC|nr:uncharacterized protein LAJ45_08265 [Morchella importuna]KAH8147799.1 hypothetical protein LAJ45_08265 [Morchella importuna]